MAPVYSNYPSLPGATIHEPPVAPVLVTVAPVCQWLAQVPVFFSTGSSLGWAVRVTHSPTAPNRGLGRDHPQKPGQNRNYVCKKAGNFIELSFLFSREAKKSEQLDQGKKKKKKEAGPRERRARSDHAQESRGQAPGGRVNECSLVPPSLLQEPSAHSSSGC